MARVAVVGVGAIGGSIAADLFELGRHDLLLCARSGFDALEVRHPGGTARVTAPVLHRPAELGPVDWVLLATKAHQSAEAVPWLEAGCGAGAQVAVLQNGVDHEERIAPLVPAGTAVLPVVVQLPAERTAPGRVEQDRDGALIVPEGETGQRFAALFEGARTRVVVHADFATQAWWKLMMNAALGGVCAVLIRDNAVAAEPPIRDLVLALMREVGEVGRACGAKLPPDAPEKTLDAVLAAAGGHWSSIVVDRREGRPMEWEVRNAVVGRLGRRQGVPTPLNDAITALLQAADAASAVA